MGLIHCSEMIEGENTTIGNDVLIFFKSAYNGNEHWIMTGRIKKTFIILTTLQNYPCWKD